MDVAVVGIDLGAAIREKICRHTHISYPTV